MGKNTFWWDFGSVDLYVLNLMKLTGKNAESKAMRHFLKSKITNQRSPKRIIKNSIVVDLSYISRLKQLIKPILS